jgi:hypothetical protein
MRHQARGLCAHPALARCSFAGLFVMAVLWHEVRGGHGDNMRPSGAYYHPTPPCGPLQG